jgi:carboxyl-terminal processing protease
VKLITLDEVEVKSVPFFAKIDEKTGYIALTHFNKKSIYRNERSA